MKRSEAIEILRSKSKTGGAWSGYTSGMADAVDLAIEALSEGEKNCKGCVHLGKDDTVYPCSDCVRASVDHYEVNHGN